MLDSATENKLPESTIENLRDHGVYVLSGPAAEARSALLTISACSEPGNRSGVAAGAKFFVARISTSIGELELGWQFCERAGHRHHRNQRQDHDDGIGRADAERVRSTHHRLRQHRQTAVRSRRANNRRSRCADGRSQLVSARNDPQIFVPQISGLAELRARSSRSLRLGRANIARPSCASLNIRPQTSSRLSMRVITLPRIEATRA